MRRLAATLAVALVATFVLAVEPSGASGPVVRHVSPGGDDAAAGTASAPFRTLGRALTALLPGDTLVVHGGEYAERIRNPAIRPGLPWAPVHVVAAPGERPVLQGLLWLSAADHWTIEGLEVTWSAANSSTEHMVKMTGGTGWRLTGSTLWGARSYAALLVAGQPVGFRIDGNVIRDTHATNGTNQDHLVYVNAGMGGGVIEHNVLANSPNGRGIKIGPSSASTTPIGNLVIRNNTFFNNTGPSNIQLSYGATGNLIERNVLQRPQAGREAITAYELNGTANVVRDNVAWETARVAEAAGGVIEAGNFTADPQLADPARGDYRVGNPALAGYGASSVPAAPAAVPAASDPSASTAAPAQVTASGATRPALRAAGGYRMLAADGGIFSFGDAGFHGSTGDLRLNRPIVGGASTATGDGYWLVASDGGIFTFGDAGFHGSAGGLGLAEPIVGMAATPSGQGYWLVGRDGAVYAFGDAGHHGDARGRTGRAVGIVSTRSGGGYWVAGADGRIAALGDAAPFGETGPLNHPIVGLAATSSGNGFWLVARDGGIFSFGDAAFHGSTGNLRLNQPIVGMSATPGGYRLVAGDGGVFSFGDAPFHGSTGDLRLNSPIIAFV